VCTTENKHSPNTIAVPSLPDKVRPGRQQDGEGFTRPATPTLTPQEYMERDEVLKLRAAGLKKAGILINHGNTCMLPIDM